MDKRMKLGNNVEHFFESEECKIYQIKDETGEGVMTSFSVFPGVYIIYNDFHMAHCISKFKPSTDILCIDHCKEGRLEWELKKDKYIYLEAGDFEVDNRHNSKRTFNFPLNHYHGITINILIDEANKALNNCVKGVSVDLYEIRDKFINYGKSFITKSDSTIENIFSELYAVPKEIQMEYYKIKVLELLIYLKAVVIPTNYEERPYFYKSQIMKVKAMREFMIENMDRHYTLEELSKKFDISLTTMKKCFKGVYGTSIYNYIQNYKMNMAAMKLIQTKETVAKIGLSFGYSNAGKFSAAFKKVIGKLPQEYRLENIGKSNAN